jgi:hypothetical protein
MNFYEVVEWEKVKKEQKFNEKDENNGYIYGLYYYEGNDELQIKDVEWFKTEEKRNEAIQELIELGYKEIQ